MQVYLVIVLFRHIARNEAVVLQRVRLHESSLYGLLYFIIDSEHLFLGRDIHALFLRSHNGDSRVRSEISFGCLINSISAYHRQELFHYLILRLYSGAGLFAREITNVLTGKRLVLTRVALVIRFLHIVHRLGLSQLKLCISETVTTHFLQLNKQLLERLCLTSFFRNADSLEAVLEFEELGIIRIETYRRSLRFHRYLLKPQQLAHPLPVDRVCRARKRAAAKRHFIHSAVSVFEPAKISHKHIRIRHKMMCKGYRLRPLQMRVPGHYRGRVLFGDVRHRLRKLFEQRNYLPRFVLERHSHVKRHLVIPRPRRV